MKSTKWDSLKTDAISFTDDFYWFEDYPFQAEKNVLIKNHCLSSLITVNLRNEDELFNIIEKLKLT